MKRWRYTVALAVVIALVATLLAFRQTRQRDCDTGLSRVAEPWYCSGR